jgi:acetaldehyde dehydrogenase
MTRRKVAIVGSGNIGTDLMLKVLRSPSLELSQMVGVDPRSEGLRRARDLGVDVSAEGVSWLLSLPTPPDIVFEATSAGVHATNAPAYLERGITAIDLTPAAVGPYVVPSVNLLDLVAQPNLNMVTCGGQATVPIVAAVSAATTVHYAEIVASIASRSAGPGTRANIDEFTRTTANALVSVGGAARGKAIIVLNPVEPPMIMRNTVFCEVPAEVDESAVTASVERMVETVRGYVPGYRLRAVPQFDSPRPEWHGHSRVAVFLEIEGRGDYLPPYAGNLDIMTAAAVRVAELLAGAPR